MTDDEYQCKRKWLLEVLTDAKDRGDYHLEMDVLEKLSNLQDEYYKED
jgi:hypothetical protein